MTKTITIAAISILLIGCDHDHGKEHNLSASTNCPEGGVALTGLKDGDTVHVCKDSKCFILLTIEHGASITWIFNPDDGTNTKFQNNQPMTVDRDADGNPLATSSGSVDFPSTIDRSGSLLIIVKDDQGNELGRISLKIVVDC